MKDKMWIPVHEIRKQNSKNLSQTIRKLRKMKIWSTCASHHTFLPPQPSARQSTFPFHFDNLVAVWFRRKMADWSKLIIRNVERGRRFSNSSIVQKCAWLNWSCAYPRARVSCRIETRADTFAFWKSMSVPALKNLRQIIIKFALGEKLQLIFRLLSWLPIPYPLPYDCRVTQPPRYSTEIPWNNVLRRQY